MSFSKLFNSQAFKVYLVIIFLGIYVHTYFIPIGRIGLKFFYFVLLIHLIEVVIKTNHIKIRLNLFDYFLLGTFLYILVQFSFTYSVENHLISSMYLMNIILVARFALSKLDKFLSNADTIYYLHIIIFGIGIFLFFYAIFVVGLGSIALDYLYQTERREMANKITTTVFYTGVLPRYTGYYVDPNFWALHITFALYLLISIKMFVNRNNRLFYIAVIILLFSIILTQSRGAFLALILAYFIYMFLSFIYKTLSSYDIKIFFYLMAFMFIIIILLLSLDGVYGIDFEYMLGRYDSSNLTNENARTLGWQEYIEYISSSKYLYQGFGLSSNVYYFSHHSSHNMYIYLLYNFGLVWLILFLLFIIMTLFLLLNKIKSVVKKRKKLYIISTAFFIGLLAQAFFIDVLFVIPFWANFVLTYKLLDTKGNNI